YMPVGTLASVKSLDSQDITQTQAQIILANTLHLYLRPGMETLVRAGGVHQFMNWHLPMLTDSGGFQVFSLAGEDGQLKVSDTGVVFPSPYDGSKHFFTPQKAIELQRQIGADIIMTFDQCT